MYMRSYLALFSLYSVTFNRSAESHTCYRLAENRTPSAYSNYETWLGIMEDASLDTALPCLHTKQTVGAMLLTYIVFMLCPIA